MGLLGMGEERRGDVVDELLSSLLGNEGDAQAAIAKEQALVRVRVERRKRHLVTVIEFDSSEAKAIDVEGIARELKRRLATGGTVRGNVIEVQGDQRARVRRLLVELGFREENILVDESIVET
ncbi:MAG: translation initiation factor [Vulcanisaeta sp.]|nr:translation initiation factor [Vulcanisaeta sp.]